MLGFVLYTIEPLSKFYLFAAILYFLYRIISNSNRKDEVLLAAGYITGYEVLSRMTGGAFSYEFAKYAVIGFLCIGMFYRGFTMKSWPYILFLLFLIPGVLFSAINLDYESSVGNAIGFNLSGPVCLAISAMYCYDRKIPARRFQDVLLSVLLPIISITTYLYLYTPSIRDTLSGTGSNFAASGGFGPNQVATVLGLGMFILFSRLFLIKNKFINIVDLVLMALMSYRAIATFSRGGVITALVCALAFVFFYFLKSDLREKAALVPKVAFIAFVVTATWFVTSFSTMGLIDKRYSNQDAAGEIKEDITTGRKELITAELEAFFEYPLTGIGVGKVKEYRFDKTGHLSATHNEVSRILSEHGVFGVLGLIILIFTPLLFRAKNRSNLYLFSFFIFWFFTINHSSMRIAASAFIYGLALITILDEKKTAIHRK